MAKSSVTKDMEAIGKVISAQPRDHSKMSARDRKFWRENDLAELERSDANSRMKLMLGGAANCPFCGAEPDEDDGPEITGTHPGTDWVECNGCGASGPHQKRSGIVKGAAQRALDAWVDRS
jgi:restriction alleviation protein Lar